MSLLGLFGHGASTTDTLLELVDRIGQDDAVEQLREPISQMTETDAAGFAFLFGCSAPCGARRGTSVHSAAR